MEYDALIVGGGIAGLTAASFLAKSGYQVLLCEKEAKTGGLINSFSHNGFVFDGGIRAIENSGIVNPMLRQLGIEMEFLDNQVSVGIGDDIIRLHGRESLTDYRDMLVRAFPSSKADVGLIIEQVKQTMKDMDILYGIDNPLFLEMKENGGYLIKTILPWMFKYLLTVGRIQKLDMPVESYLKSLSTDTAMIDLISQHFFKQTPAFFAMSYFSQYLDYRYPKGGTGELNKAMESYATSHGAEIKTSTTIQSVDLSQHKVTDYLGNAYQYKKLIWACDLKTLYRISETSDPDDKKTVRILREERKRLEELHGGDSVITVYIEADLPKEYFEEKCSAHFFYTPSNLGLHDFIIESIQLKNKITDTYTKDIEILKKWIAAFFRLTTYEISIPSLRDPSMSPEGKTGLIVGTLFDYSLMRHFLEIGWYEEAKKVCEHSVIEVLTESVFEELSQKCLAVFSSTPLSIERITANSEGAITGWGFDNPLIPVIHELKKVAHSVETPLADVLQIGQWSYSPSGMPISILTGKLAADRIRKELNE